MSNTIDIKQWLEEDKDDLIDGNDIDSEDELGDQVEINNENTNTENSDYESESESSSDDVGPILQNKYFFGKDKTRWNKQAPIEHVLII
jgi:hypothetical protein